MEGGQCPPEFPGSPGRHDKDISVCQLSVVQENQVLCTYSESVSSFFLPFKFKVLCRLLKCVIAKNEILFV